MAITECTWTGCKRGPKHIMKNMIGEIAARLCDKHRAEMDAAIKRHDHAKAWSSAQGDVVS